MIKFISKSPLIFLVLITFYSSFNAQYQIKSQYLIHPEKPLDMLTAALRFGSKVMMKQKAVFIQMLIATVI